MTAATWSTDDSSLERHYRKLLLAYRAGTGGGTAPR